MTDKQSQAEIFGSDRMWGLKELPLPDPVSWWPQTPGWYLLGTLFLPACATWPGACGYATGMTLTVGKA
jgi:hypothetical protein